MTTEELRSYSLLVILASWVRSSGHPTVPVRGHSARPAMRKCLLSFGYSHCALIPPTVPVPYLLVWNSHFGYPLRPGWFSVLLCLPALLVSLGYQWFDPTDLHRTCARVGCHVESRG